MAARGACAAGRARAARRCAHAHELGRARVADQHRGILARIAGGGLGRRPQPADRLPLERKRPHPLEPTRDGTDFARPRCRPGWHRRDHASAAARQQHRTNRVCAEHRPGRRRRCREPVATWHQCHRLHPVRVHSEREMARVAEGNRARLNARSSRPGCGGPCRDWSMGGHPGRGRPARRGADAHRPARHPRDAARHLGSSRKSATAA